MNLNTHSHRLVHSLLATLTLVAAAASAQTAPTATAPTAPPPDPVPLPTRSISASAMGTPQAMLPMASEQALERLRERLQLSADQQDAWRRYTRAVDACNGLLLRERPATPRANEAAPQQVAHVVDLLQNRLAAVEEVERAARALQAVLSPEQQQVANEGLLATLPPMLGLNMAGGDGRDRREGAPQRPSEGGRMRRGGMRP